MKQLFTPLLLLALAYVGLHAGELALVDGSNHDMRIVQSNAEQIELRSTGVDPQIVFETKGGTQPTPEQHILSFEYFCPDGIDFVEVFYAKDSKRPGWSQSRQLEGGALPKAEAWQPYAINLQTGTKGKWTPSNTVIRLDFGRSADKQIQLRNLQLRAPTVAEQINAAELEAIQAKKIATAEVIEAYVMRADWPTRISGVSVCDVHIHIEGKIENDTGAPVLLVEYMPHQNPWDPNSGTVLSTNPIETTYNVVLPRILENGQDRIANRYALATRLEDGKSLKLLSPASWATSLCCAAERDMPRLRPANKKGLGGITYKKGIYHDDLNDLGITASTVNIELSGLVNLGPKSKTIDYVHQGKTWRFNAKAVHEHDKNIKQLTEKGIITSAIILVGKGAGNLVHPDYNTAGIYSMANLTTQTASDHYRAVVSFLAERYSRPDKEHGWITHWIVFNEVDYGWIWTNMGETPMATYMDAYEKAMRLTYIEARRFNPTAEVFISLTHHWSYSPSDKFRAYPPRDLLDRMADYTALSGDYQWAIAYHPYPQSLLKPRTWEDSKATQNFDTRYVTPKNIEILDAYLSQEPFLFNGKTRTIVLSEQGYHTPDYSEKSMMDKAAAIAYTWAKIMPLDSIESFHYHRWVDHPMEGGLKVGFRTLPSDEHEFGVRKEPAFTVYGALETADEAQAIEPLKRYLRINDFSELDTK